MRVISKNPQFPNFWAEHLDAEEPLMGWLREAKKAEWTNFADVRQSSATASQVNPFVVFNIGGNKYRLITRINYQRQIVYIRAVLTHEEYDEGTWKTE
jgi:mRNA interferase HigB